MSISKSRARIKLYLLFPPLCFLVFAYPPMRLVGWLWPQIARADLWIGFTIIGLLAMFLLRRSFQRPRMRARFVAVQWLGCAFILCVLVLPYELARLASPIDDIVAAVWLLGFAVAISIAAVIRAQFIAVKLLRIHSEKITSPARIAQLSDVHIGSRGGGYLARLVRRVNQLQPHAVVITGDLVDSTSVGRTQLQALADLRAPTLFTLGNHERYANADAVIHILREFGVETLRGQQRTLCNINFIGVDDAEEPRQVARALSKIPRADGYSVLLYHRPRGWRDARRRGVDLMLCGHTHNGQIFPFNLLVKHEFKRIRGLYKKDNAYLYVSPGSGTWGPTMRLGSRNEITCIDLAPAAAG